MAKVPLWVGMRTMNSSFEGNEGHPETMEGMEDGNPTAMSSLEVSKSVTPPANESILPNGKRKVIDSRVSWDGICYFPGGGGGGGYFTPSNTFITCISRSF